MKSWFLWFGKSHTHISSSQYSLIDKKLLQVSSRSQISGLDLSVGSEIKKELKNTSGQTYVKDDFANLDDFEAKPITSPKMRVHSTYLLHCLSFVFTRFFCSVFLSFVTGIIEKQNFGYFQVERGNPESWILKSSFLQTAESKGSIAA